MLFLMQKCRFLAFDVDAIRADSLGVAAVLLLVLFGFKNQVLGFVVWIQTDPVQEGKPITHGNTNLGTRLNRSSRLASTMGRTCR